MVRPAEKKNIYILLYFIKKVLKYRCCRKKGRKCKHSDEQLTLYCRHFHACFSRLTTIAVINYQQNWHQKHPGQATRRSKNPLQTIRQGSNQRWHQTRLIGRAFDCPWQSRLFLFCAICCVFHIVLLSAEEPRCLVDLFFPKFKWCAYSHFQRGFVRPPLME